MACSHRKQFALIVDGHRFDGLTADQVAEMEHPIYLRGVVFVPQGPLSKTPAVFLDGERSEQLNLFGEEKRYETGV